MVRKTANKTAPVYLSRLLMGAGVLALIACSDDNPKTRFFEINEVSPPIEGASVNDGYEAGSWKVDINEGAWVTDHGGYPLTEGSLPPPVEMNGQSVPQMRGSIHYGPTSQNKIPVAGPLGGVSAMTAGAPMVMGHPVHGLVPPPQPDQAEIQRTAMGQAYESYAGGPGYGGRAAGVAGSSAQPAFGTMTGSVAAPNMGNGARGTTLIDPATGMGRDFRNVVLNPQTMDPRNVNRQALDRLSAMSIRGYTMQATTGADGKKVWPQNAEPPHGMSSPRAKPYWEMIADDIAEQMFSIKPPGTDFYYIEPANHYRNRAADAIFRDVLAKSLRQRGVQIAPAPDYATAYVRIKVDSFNLNPLGFTGNVNPPDYTPIIRDDGHMMMVLDRGLTQARNPDLSPVAAEGDYASMVDVDPFVRPFTGIMVSGIVEQKHRAAYRIHGAYYIDRKDI